MAVKNIESLTPYKGQWFVVKIGGELAQDRNALANSVGKSIRLFLDAGIKVAVVHGGGPQATLLSTRLGIETKQVGGRRITDEATLEVMKMSLAGQVSVDAGASGSISTYPAVSRCWVRNDSATAGKQAQVSPCATITTGGDTSAPMIAAQIALDSIGEFRSTTDRPDSCSALITSRRSDHDGSGNTMVRAGPPPFVERTIPR